MNFFAAAVCCLATALATTQAKPSFTASAQQVEVYDFVEVSARAAAVGGNPFTTVEFTGELQHENEPALPVTGFCDSADGSLFRIRFLAVAPGIYRYTVRLRHGGESASYSGEFRAVAHGRRGRVRIDPAYPFHFVWEGTGEHYFWNGLTTYALMGWQDESTIRSIVDRAARLKVNRLRVCLNGPRVADASRWYEPVKPSRDFRFLFGPWIASHPDSVSDPGWDVTRFDVAFWQKYERLLRYARERGVVISVIFFLDGEDRGADPFGKAGAFGPDEQRYYRYAAARFSAFTNVMWDVTNEWHLFRSAWWVQRTGTLLKASDPWQHLTSCHGRGEFPWGLSFWPDFALYQLWDEHGGYAPMLERRRKQEQTGRPMPQVNEEYGYEDHYPVKWGENRRPPARSADNRRRLAWEIAMAGCYQTTGERAHSEQRNGAATPGGWINGGFDASMTMLDGYRHMVDFFTSIEYWKLAPMPELAAGPDVLVLAERDRQYVVYYRGATRPPFHPGPGQYQERWFNPRSGEWTGAKRPAASETGDWVLYLKRDE